MTPREGERTSEATFGSVDKTLEMRV
uniref:Uncharacterized protein n=1 Tax=Arundo donax TaxID=35708 RepID=A0A0A9RHG5_ARUDO